MAVNLKAKRTQAVAPRSLFGTVMEVKNEEDVVNAEKLPLPPRPTKPDKLAAFMPRETSGVMRHEEQEVARQMHKARFAENDLAEASHQALHFKPNPDTIMSGIPDGALTFKPKSYYAPYQQDIKLHSRDIALTEHFNSNLGIDANPDYNYERYRRPYQHGNFKQAGTILGKGGSFRRRDPINGKSFGRKDPSLRALRESFPPTRQPVPAIGHGHMAFPTETIPDNIRALHGRELCKQMTQREELPRGPTPQEKRIPGPLIMSKFPSVKTNIELKTDPMYDALGTSLKQDIFNGVSHSHVKSLYKSSFTQDIHDKSVQAHPPKFAILRNADSKWNEDVVIRQRIFKAWDAMVIERQQAKGS
ncbi:uncharacterized protein [Diadema antillarum]|uniref:uncharacterized protein n=1 Tax=Diadema antillarum TaxID=105358 RepID=UPI003A8C3DF7